ncbi:TetR/AcrR family transcriptional regulator [Methanobrevibacter sp. TMH8]|uniref:TetR/AcrR family transcriptional regulator n=1 Tax=Methanobrevibacter sp. TMH8 TaxID=2848611 RepID=UPI001CCA3CDA|nr:TetR/AcrR family transcriptional regulator [Methanobrevibacter sp. TMH8]MBZ9571558.1 TetR/AcrR family transcriptional regulator [Methanobrevibacter sp. TMH8]
MNTKDKILETTFLLSLKYGYANVSIKQIKEECGMSASSIYHYFTDKDDILSQMIDKYILNIVDYNNEIMKNVSGSFIEKLKFIFYYSIGINIKEESQVKITKEPINYKNYHLMFNSIYHQYPEYREKFNKLNESMLLFFKELIDEAIENNEIGNVNSEEVAIFIFSIIKGYTELWVGLPEYSLDEIIDININNIWRAIK